MSLLTVLVFGAVHNSEQRTLNSFLTNDMMIIKIVIFRKIERNQYCDFLD